MKLTETKRCYGSGQYVIEIELNLSKNWYTLTVWDSDNEIVVSFDSEDKAKEVAKAILQATHDNSSL